MKKLKQLFRKFHNKNQGLTLVEMIVTFMLIGLFMIAASKVIANTVSVYYTAKGTANGMQVSSIIASKIRGEIEGARDATITTEVKMRMEQRTRSHYHMSCSCRQMRRSVDRMKRQGIIRSSLPMRRAVMSILA